MNEKHQRVDHTQRRVDHTQKRGDLDSLGKVVRGSWEKVGNKDHLPQDAGLVEEGNCVMERQDG